MSLKTDIVSVLFGIIHIFGCFLKELLVSLKNPLLLSAISFVGFGKLSFGYS
jgi:hypothetical protein